MNTQCFDDNGRKKRSSIIINFIYLHSPQRFAPHGDLLLLEVAPILLVDENQVQVVFYRELVVDVSVRGGELRGNSIQEEPHGDALPLHRSTVHDLKLCHCLALVVQVRPRSGRLTADDCKLHVLDLDSHQKEVNLPNNDVIEVVFLFLILKLNVEAVLNSDLGIGNSNWGFGLGWVGWGGLGGVRCVRFEIKLSEKQWVKLTSILIELLISGSMVNI